MNEANDYLEAELASLRPRDASPELRRRIADHRARSRSPSSRRRWGFALAGGLAAACVMAAVLLRWGGGQGVEPVPLVVLPPPAPSAEVEDSAPRRLVYWRTLARSPEELDALLDKDSMLSPNLNPDLVRISTLTRSDAALHALLGED